MKAAIYVGPNLPLEIDSVHVDSPRSHEVRVQVAASGLCHSDLHKMKGALPRPAPSVFGHEAAGVVTAVGSSVSKVKVGDRVICCGALFCGQCDPCTSGHANLCAAPPMRSAQDPSTLTLASGERLNQLGSIGGYAEVMLVHEQAIVKAPDALPLDRGALLGCAVLTGVGAVFNAAKVRPGSSVAIIGCGGVGLNVIQAARIAGAQRIIAIDLQPEKLELATKFGATDVVTGGEDAVEAVRELSLGGVDYSFEVIGYPKTIEQAVSMLKRGGTMTLLGASPVGAEIALPSLSLMMNEWKIQGSLMGSGPYSRDIPRIASLYLNGQLDLDSLISERIGLDDINHGFSRMEGGTHARSVIVFDDVLREADKHLH